MANRPPVTLDGKTGKPDDAPRLVRTPPIKLDSLRAIRDEAGRVYREMRTGKMATQDGTRLVFVLGQMRELCLEIEIEERIRKLEEGRQCDKS